MDCVLYYQLLLRTPEFMQTFSHQISGPDETDKKKTHDTVSLNTLQLTTPLVNNSIAGPFNSLCICQKHCLPN